MTFLPIVERELRVASRRRGTYWTRVVWALGGLIIAFFVVMANHRSPAQTLGGILFASMGVIILISAATMLRFTADSLSEEKRDGTLGLLFLTDLKGYDVVFGKLVANSLGALYGMLAIFPVLAISLLLGGVTYTEFWRVVLTALNILFLSLSVGLFASAVCRDERKALALGVVILVLLVALLPIVGATILWNTSRGGSTWANWQMFVLPSPVCACVLSFETFFKMKPTDYWISSGITHLYGWLFLAIASAIVPRSWQDKAAKSSAPGSVAGLPPFVGERARFRTALLNINPFYWLASREKLKMKLIWIPFVLVALAWIWGYAETSREWFNEGVYLITALFLHGVLKCWLATEACRRFIEDRRSGAMELVLSTPLTVHEILRGQRLALWRQFGPPAIAVLGLDFILLFATLGEVNHDRWEWATVWLAGIIIFAMDMVALSWSAMWTGATAQKTNRASASAISRILVAPWLVFGVILSGVAILSISPALRTMFNRINLPDATLPLLWFAISFINNILWMNHAKRNLRKNFREIATERMATPRGFFGWLTGK